jgi:hypothetical protein
LYGSGLRHSLARGVYRYVPLSAYKVLLGLWRAAARLIPPG